MPTLTPIHRRMGDYVLANLFRAATMRIDELASVVGASVASANRFARALGFDGYPQFREALVCGFEATLAPVEGRPVAPDDTVIVDLIGSDGDSRKDYVIELGRGAVVEEIEQGLVGMSAGETKEMSFELADGTTQSLTATVNLESARAMRLEVGEPLAALIKASHVILAVE